MESHIENVLKKYNLTLENAPQQNIVIYIHGFSFTWDENEVNQFNQKLLADQHQYILGMKGLSENLRGLYLYMLEFVKLFIVYNSLTACYSACYHA